MSIPSNTNFLDLIGMAWLCDRAALGCRDLGETNFAEQLADAAKRLRRMASERIKS